MNFRTETFEGFSGGDMKISSHYRQLFILSLIELKSTLFIWHVEIHSVQSQSFACFKMFFCDRNNFIGIVNIEYTTIVG